jgi:hypothetical protein
MWLNLNQYAPFTCASPEFCNFLGSLMQPVLVSSQANHFDSREPFRGIRSRIAQLCQLAHIHQNLNVTLREAEELGRDRNIQPGWQSPCPKTPHATELRHRCTPPRLPFHWRATIPGLACRNLFGCSFGCKFEGLSMD